ncbi:MAG TPA: FAD-dependent oxidoreductase [Solirubrobacteraceae bacterium]|nr:FAD-dependent oxidoreductase [Solirubrobacteraceae bacterium]
MSAQPRVLVLGGGFAGLEAAFLLRMRLHDRVALTVVSDRDSFLFRPNLIYVPFGADPEQFVIPLDKPLGRRGIAREQGRIGEVDTDARRVTLEDGRALDYDRLIVATGSGVRPEEIPGLAEHACTIWEMASLVDLRGRLEAVRDDAHRGKETGVLFLVPPNNKCAGPLYELVFMFETWLRRSNVRDRVRITWSTFERSYIQAFGPRLHEVVTKEFAERGVDGHVTEVVTEVTADEVRYADGSTRRFDLLISFPPYISAVTYPGLPSDDRGFLKTDFESRLVAGQEHVYAPGDAGDFPIKQAFLAFLQADAVASTLASELGGVEPATPFDPVSMCIMEMFDNATFAQVPLELTGDPVRPVRVRPGAEDDYKVGVSPMWRLGKKMLGMAIPMRFSAGEPFHAGRGWQLMDVGLKGMKGILAD